MNRSSIPGWTMFIDEISNGVYKVTLKNNNGNVVEITDLELDTTIERAIEGAFDLEKQTSMNWNLFLYDLASQRLSDKEFMVKEYTEKAFGSWTIELQNKRLVFDGKDSLLILQCKSLDRWDELEIIKKDELMYSNFVRQITLLTEINTPNNTLPKAELSWLKRLFGSD